MLETGNDYYQAWGIYVAAVLVAHLLLWRLLRKLPFRGVKTVLHLCMAALLLTPAALEPGQNYWVPAIMAAAMEGLNNGMDAATARLMPILVVMLLLLCLSFGWSLYRYWRAKPRRDEATAAVSPQPDIAAE